MKFSTSSSRSSSLITLLGVFASGALVSACAAEDPVDEGATSTEASMSNSATAAPIQSSAAPTSTTTNIPTSTVPAPTNTPTGPNSTTLPPMSTPTASTTAPVTSNPTPTASGSEEPPPVTSTDPSTDPTPGPTSSEMPAPTSSNVEVPPMGNKDHCLYGYDPHPTDATMASGPAIYMPAGGGKADTTLQPEVLQWMDENKWTGAHVVWHAVRGCTNGSAGGLLAPLGFPDICKDYPFLIPTDQNCQSAGDGYQFLLFHRHMMEVLKQLWPTHAEDFDGFDKFPTTKAELPEIWNETDPSWNAQILAAAEIGDNIEENLDLFPDEGSLGFWLQCPVGTRAPSFAPQMPYVGLHFNLHDQWSRGAASPHGLNNGQVNITNYMFWKLHGWIDKVWEKYRVAKGLTTDEAAMQKYTTDMTAACREMDTEIEILQEMPGNGPQFDCPPEADESGYFHTTVRPIFESEKNHCAGCHGPLQTSPYADLTLGGAISSKCLVERLKKTSVSGGQYKIVEPGEPENSWLYLKASGMAEGAGCVDGDVNACNTATMPPSGKTMTDAELELLYNWIADGANE